MTDERTETGGPSRTPRSEIEPAVSANRKKLDRLRAELAACRERNAAIAVQSDQYRDERDDARAEREKAYSERAALVAHLAACYPSVMLTDSAETDWPIVFVSTSAGQMSWHVAKADLELFGHVPATTEPTWDGHTTEVKYQRLAELTRQRATAAVAPELAAYARTILPPPGAVVSAAYLTAGPDGPKIILEICPHCTAATGDDSRMCLCRAQCTYAACRHDDPMTLLVTGAKPQGGDDA